MRNGWLYSAHSLVCGLELGDFLNNVIWFNVVLGGLPT